jgi:hypothetical protein
MGSWEEDKGESAVWQLCTALAQGCTTLGQGCIRAGQHGMESRRAPSPDRANSGALMLRGALGRERAAARWHKACNGAGAGQRRNGESCSAATSDPFLGSNAQETCPLGRGSV